MTTDTPSKPIRRRRRWLAVGMAIAVWWVYANAEQTEGHYETSPDGSWTATVTSVQRHKLWVLDHIELKRANDAGQPMRWRVDPPVGLKLGIRGKKPVRWSDDSSSVDIVLDGRVWITLRVPTE